MVNNDILRRVRYALNIKDRTMLDIFKYGENPITHEELLNLLKREGEEDFLKCSNKVLEAFLDFKNISKEELLKQVKAKKAEKGGFTKFLLMNTDK